MHVSEKTLVMFPSAEKSRKDKLIKTSSKRKWNRNPRAICGENTAIDYFLQNNRTVMASPINMIRCSVSEYQWREKRYGYLSIFFWFSVLIKIVMIWDLWTLLQHSFFLPETLLSNARELYEQASDSMSFHISSGCM